jgi:hypothetical protein
VTICPLFTLLERDSEIDVGIDREPNLIKEFHD